MQKFAIYIKKELCKGCRFCVEFCPKGVLRVSSEFNKKGYHPPEIVDGNSCTGCKNCEYLCPEFAIWVVKAEGSK